MEILSYLLGKKASGGGGGQYGWHLLKSQEFECSTENTSSEKILTIDVGDEIWTSDKIIAVRIKDKAGKRDGYFNGSLGFCINGYPLNTQTTSSASFQNNTAKSNTTGQSFLSQSQYGIYTSNLGKNGGVHIYARYSNLYSGIIDGTYVAEVYALDFPNGQSIFE